MCDPKCENGVCKLTVSAGSNPPPTKFIEGYLSQRAAREAAEAKAAEELRKANEKLEKELDVKLKGFSRLTLKVKKLTQTAKVPTLATEGSAGWDLYADEDVLFSAPCRYMISTGVAVAIPSGYVGLLCSRSGMVAKTGIHVANQPGVIDSDYRGEVKVILTVPASYNKPYQISKGDKIAQLVIVAVPKFEMVETETLDETLRGEGGFGSTGTK